MVEGGLWFSVRALLRQSIGGRATDLFQDRIILVQAHTMDHAKKRGIHALSTVNAYAGTDGQLVAWRFMELVEVVCIGEQIEEGMCIYSKQRRIEELDDKRRIILNPIGEEEDGA